MKDRLEELMKTAEENLVDNGFGGIDNVTFEGTEFSKFDPFFNDVSAISSNLNKLERLIYSIQKQQAKVLCGTAKDSIYKEKRCLKDAKHEFTREAKNIQSQLDGMKADLPQERNDEQLSVEYRIRQCQLNALVARYRQILTSHYATETEYVSRLKQQIVRQTQLAGLQLQEDDVDHLVENLAPPQIVGRDLEIHKAKQHLALAQERHKQLLLLECQIAELHELFFHLEVLVMEQQEVVNSIEYNVLRTVDYVSQSSNRVKTALKYQKKSRVTAAAAAILALCACAPCIANLSS
ncbi:syntaxin-1A-like [Carcharodon carcharias]|uniref:syntaxin-1A-like n=1 Tax=Carcharodon carcharias TaxID=13397 RepID=UPI001B7E8380|nr:syntaxin-1A-like [Carcharodon carcharias]